MDVKLESCHLTIKQQPLAVMSGVIVHMNLADVKR